jgi:hypothetical protein
MKPKPLPVNVLTVPLIVAMSSPEFPPADQGVSITQPEAPFLEAYYEYQLDKAHVTDAGHLAEVGSYRLGVDARRRREC